MGYKSIQWKAEADKWDNVKSDSRADIEDVSPDRLRGN